MDDSLGLLKRYAEATITNPLLRDFLLEALEKAAAGQRNQLRHAMGLHSYPVHIEEFMFSTRYLSRPKSEIYPAVMDELISINEQHGRVINTITEAVFTGGIGSAKTTTALYTLAYQLYLLSCYRNPHQTFGMDSTSEIIFIFQSLKALLAKEVDFDRFRTICQQSYYFTTVFPYAKDVQSKLVFPNRIEVKPIGSDSGAIGQNVLGGLIDEVNFMQVVEESKKMVGNAVYDQAKIIYDSVSRRIKTRFIDQGGMPGILCLVSSKNYPGEFTDVKIEEAKTDPTIYVYYKRVWDIKPPGTFSGETFTVFTGDEGRRPRLVDRPHEIALEDQELLIEAPVEFRQQFERDIIGSLRDLAGIGTMARVPYIQEYEKVQQAFGRTKSVLTKQVHDFQESTPLLILPNRFVDTHIPRWVHVDLAVSGDSAGVACGYAHSFEARGNELLPVVKYDFLLQVVPPKGGEIKFYRIRDLLHKLKLTGLDIRWVTFDSFQSVDSVQLLRQAGYATGYVSMDTETLPYDMTKSAFYDGRIWLPEHQICQREFLSLERVRKNTKFKVDHPPNGSKDVSDAVAGVFYGISTNRATYVLHGVPLTRAPEAVQKAQTKAQPKDERQEEHERQIRHARYS